MGYGGVEGTPRKSVRYSLEMARAIADESSDLPHLPGFAFAPPPMTPPGTQMCSHRGQKRAPRRDGEGGIKVPPVAEMMGSRSGVGVSTDDKSGASSGGGGGGGGGKDLSSFCQPRRPVNNGVGFRRLCCRRARNQSGGGSMDFADMGFDEIDFEDDEEEVGVVTKTSVCFFSVGFDASIAMQFHQFRERTPCCADSVSKVVAGHAWLGLAELLSSRKYLRPGVITLRVDGVEVPIPPEARTVQCFNIHSSATVGRCKLRPAYPCH